LAAGRWLAGQGVKLYASDAADTAAIRAAVRTLVEAGASAECGRHDLGRIARAAAVVVSPGVPPDAAPVRAARDAGVEVLAEIDLAARMITGAKLLVVTGTNGKSTTTALAAHLLQAAGIRAVAAGNIGLPLIEVASNPEPYEWMVVEVSSFQLHDAPNLKPAVGVLTNLSPDHLDRYPDVESYYGDKRRLFRNATADSVWVLNGDDRAVLELARDVAGAHRYFSLREQRDAWYDREAGELILDGRSLVPRSQVHLMGDHNVQNALAAALAVQAAGGVGAAKIARGLRSFAPLAHRLEPVREVDGVLWINDSKATNVAAAAVGLSAMDRPTVLIMGGRCKGERFEPLADLLSRHGRALVAYGEARDAIAAALAGIVQFQEVAAFDQAVQWAREKAIPGDAVLLSPACASFDQFAGYEERGARFRSLVESF
jgi:UDP-N-acetylmuramoylalanine--D-glutamate ligase